MLRRLRSYINISYAILGVASRSQPALCDTCSHVRKPFSMFASELLLLSLLCSRQSQLRRHAARVHIGATEVNSSGVYNLSCINTQAATALAAIRCHIKVRSSIDAEPAVRLHRAFNSARIKKSDTVFSDYLSARGPVQHTWDTHNARPTMWQQNTAMVLPSLFS